MASDEKKLEVILDRHQKYLDAIHDGIVEGIKEGIKKGTAKGSKRAAWDALKKECLPQGFMNVSASDIENIVRHLSELLKNVDGDITGAINKIIESNIKQYRDKLIADIISMFRSEKPELALALELITKRESKIADLIGERLPDNPISSGIVKGVKTALKIGIDRSTQGFRNKLKDKFEGVENSKGESQETVTTQRIEQIKADSKRIIRDAVAKVVEEIIYELINMLLTRVIARLKKELKEKLLHKLEHKLGDITKQKLEQVFEKSIKQLVEEIGKDCVNETSFIENIDRTFGDSAKNCLKSLTKWLTPLKAIAITVIILGGIGGVVFAWPNQTYTLNTSVSPLWSGSVNPSSGDFNPDERVTITALPDTGWEFDYWGGDASGGFPTLTIYMDSDKSVTAHFIPKRVTLYIDVSGEGNTDPSPDSHTYNIGANVSITALPNPGWEFDYWSGDTDTIVDIHDQTTTITMSDDYSITAKFKLSNSIFDFIMEPPSPETLDYGTPVNIKFSYSTNEVDGVLISVVPFSNGVPAPNSPALLPLTYPQGQGSGSRLFTILSGPVDGIEVDQIRLHMRTADESEPLYDIFIPVNYTFINIIE